MAVNVHEPGLEKISRAISEVLTIENCSICLQKLKETVLLWPCGHWFCHGCVRNLHSNTKGKKTLCPLCNRNTTRRSILPFHDKQKEYEDLLQTLIGALSLDLGFDVTSYKIHPSSIGMNKTNGEVNSEEQFRSPVRKSKQNVLSKPVPGPNQKKPASNKRVTRSRKSKPNNALEITRSSVSCKPPETPENYKEYKVDDWLTKTRFSLGEELMSESILDQTNKTDLEALSFSEEQLKSVSQVNNNLAQTPASSDKKENKIKPMKHPCKTTNHSTSEEFDKLLSKEKKSRFIKNTYGNNSDHKSKARRLVVDSDIFNTTENSKIQEVGNNETKKPPNNSKSSYFEDFSSGSGEEWCLNKKKRHSVLKNRKLCFKGQKTSIGSKRSKKVSNIKADNLSSSLLTAEELKKRVKVLTDDLTSSTNKNLKNDEFSFNKNDASWKSDFGMKTSISQTAREIINDWENLSEINCKDSSSKQLIYDTDQVKYSTPLRDTAEKNSKLPSPGWSRLIKTKREFNLSEKKKLSLKMVNKTNSIERTTLSTKQNVSKQDLNVTNETPKLVNKQEEVNELIGLEGNQSFSTTGCTSFKGFETPVVTKKRDRDSGFCNESRFNSPEKKRICRDVEVQTSPSRMQAYIKEYLKKNLRAEEIDQLFERELKTAPFNELSNTSCPKIISACNTNINQNQEVNFLRCSQDSDKENVVAHTKEIINSEKYMDSDFVLGTEDTKTESKTKQSQFDVERPKSNTFIGPKDNMVVDNFDEVDPYAATQLNPNTPKVPKQPLKTSTGQIYSAVSNPTDSELKRVDDIFVKDDTICPEVTPISTSWNDSGIVQLEKSSEKVEKKKLELSKSQCLKERMNRSRRQLDFVEDSKSNDTDIFENSQKSRAAEQTKASNENVPAGEESVLPRENENQHIEDDFPENHLIDDHIDKSNKHDASNKEFTADDVEDFFVEGTPDNSQKSLHQEMDDAEVDGINFVETCGKSFHTEGHCQENVETVSNLEVMEKDISLNKAEQERAVISNIKSSNTPDSSLKLALTSLKNRVEEEAPKNVWRRDAVEKRDILSCERQLEENYEMSENTEDIECINYCFASSLLTGEQNTLLLKVLKGLDIPYSKTVGEHISHLIVSTTNGCTQNTYKVLYAMALHKPIIRFEWVEHVLRTGRTTVSLDPFIALDPGGECGVLRAREDKKRQLLHQFAIHVYNVIESVIKKEQIEELVRLCGGTVVTRLHQFQSVPRDMHRIIILSQPPDTSTQGEWRHKHAAAEVSVDWLYSTIGRYKVVPVAPYMVEQVDAVQFLLHEGYPEELIFETSLLNDSAAVG